MEHLRGIVAFVASAKEGSFTAAAHRLDLSPQAVAASVARLEASLDVRLFNRTTRSLSLTDEAHAFLALAEQGLATLDDATKSVRDRDSAPSGVVRVTCGAAFGRRYLLALVPDFQRVFPDVQLDLSFEDRRVDMVREGFDVAIRGGEIVDSSMIARRICGLAGVLVASPAYLKKFGTPKTPEALYQHQIIALRFTSGQTVAWELKTRAGRSSVFEIKSPALVVSDTEAVGDAAVLGLGIARVSLHFAWRHLQAGHLKIVLHDYNDPGRREMTLQYPHRENVAPRVKAFVDFAMERLTSDPSLRATIKDVGRFVA